MRARQLQPPPAIYAAVLFLRRRGHRVAPAAGGAMPDRHLLDGEIVPTTWLVDMARVEGFTAGSPDQVRGCPEAGSVTQAERE